jgi:hypothetical protein
MAKISLAFAGALLVCTVLASAQPAPKQPARRSLLVNVLDRNGNAVRDLTKDNFQITVNGRSAALLDAHYSLAPRRIVVLLDMSGSMAGQSEKNKKWRIAREALDELLTETPADVQVALLTFSSHVHDVFDFAQGRSSITAWLKSGPSQRSDIKGTTAFYDAVVAAAKLLQPARPGDAIYAITDAGDNSSHASQTDTRRLLLLAGIRLFLFMFAEPNPFDQEQVDSALKLAHETGGFVFGVTGQRGFHWFDFNYDQSESTHDRIKLYTRELNIQVNGFYALQLDTPPLTKKSSKVSLQIVDDIGKVRKDVASTYQRALPTQDK